MQLLRNGHVPTLSSIMIRMSFILVGSQSSPHYISWIPRISRISRISWVPRIVARVNGSPRWWRPTSIVTNRCVSAAWHLSHVSGWSRTGAGARARARCGSITGVRLRRRRYRLWATRPSRRVASVHLVLLWRHTRPTSVIGISSIVPHGHMMRLLWRRL